MTRRNPWRQISLSQDFAKVMRSTAYSKVPILKIDCSNHAVRGLNSKIFSITNNTSHAKEGRDLIKKHINRYARTYKL